MDLYVFSDQKESKEAIRLVRSLMKQKRKELKVVDIEKAGISTLDLQMDLGSSKIPLLDTEETVVTGLNNIRDFVMNGNHSHRRI